LVKRILGADPRLFLAARQLVYRLGGSVFRTEAEWLSCIFGNRKGVFFLQIGANDGASDDSIYPFVRINSWRGILVEPVKYLFDRLIANYSGVNGVAFENKALTEHDGKQIFYRLKETADALPGWYDQIGSLKLDVVLSHQVAIPNIGDYLVEEEVECISFGTLVSRHGVTAIDLILIDTEGYDLNILKTIDFDRFHPKLVIYEQKHLSISDKAEASRLLRSKGYVVHSIGANNAATRTAFWTAGYWR
jgi:FkbM family methyltransferase